MPKKPTLKQVGFFMSGFDSSCQYICLKSNQFCDFFKFYQCLNVPNYPQKMWTEIDLCKPMHTAKNVLCCYPDYADFHMMKI